MFSLFLDILWAETLTPLSQTNFPRKSVQWTVLGKGDSISLMGPKTNLFVDCHNKDNVFLLSKKLGRFVYSLFKNIIVSSTWVLPPWHTSAVCAVFTWTHLCAVPTGLVGEETKTHMKLTLPIVLRVIKSFVSDPVFLSSASIHEIKAYLLGCRVESQTPQSTRQSSLEVTCPPVRKLNSVGVLLSILLQPQPICGPGNPE